MTSGLRTNGDCSENTPTSRVSKIFCAPKWDRDYNYYSVPRSEEIIVVRTLPPPEVERRPYQKKGL